MVDIIKILGDIKGKVLDAAHFQVLQNAYGVQNQNIEQLKNNNAALKESNDLLKEKSVRLEKENHSLKERVVKLEQDLSTIKSSDKEISEVAKAVLQKCLEEDVTEFGNEDMIDSLSFSRMQIEAAIDELSNIGIVSLRSVSVMGSGSGYYLTREGKKFALKISLKGK